MDSNISILVCTLFYIMLLVAVIIYISNGADLRRCKRNLLGIVVITNFIAILGILVYKSCDIIRVDDHITDGDNRIILSVVGGVILLEYIGLIFVLCCKRERKRNRLLRFSNANISIVYYIKL